MNRINVDTQEHSLLNPKNDDRKEIINWSLNGKDNKLPSIIQYLAIESPTAKACITKTVNAIVGKGFEMGNKIIVHENGTTLNQFQRQCAREMATQNNVFIHVTFDGEFNPKGFKCLKSTRVRIGKPDNQEYSGKFLVADWDSKRITPDDIMKINRYNPIKSVVEAQVEASKIDKKGNKIGKIKNYLGQILHISKDSGLKYAPSDLHGVLEDALFEANSKTFRLNNSEHGFLNSKIAMVQQMTNEQRRRLKIDLQGNQGAKNSNNVLLFEASKPNADLKEQILLQDMTSAPSDKLLSYSDEKSEANICKNYEIPVSLISNRSDGIFGSSGELLTEMKRQVYEAKELDRMILEEAIASLLSKSPSINKNRLKNPKIIDPDYIIKEEESKEETPEEANKKAQATLRGSVGGVTSLLAIQQSVASGTTTKDSGIAMIVNIFGFPKEQAVSMLGEPQQINDTEL